MKNGKIKYGILNVANLQCSLFVVCIQFNAENKAFTAIGYMDIYGAHKSVRHSRIFFFLYFLFSIFFIKINSSCIMFSWSFFSFAVRWEYNNGIKYTPGTRTHAHTPSQPTKHNFHFVRFRIISKNVSFLWRKKNLLAFFFFLIISCSNEALRTRFMLFFRVLRLLCMFKRQQKYRRTLLLQTTVLFPRKHNLQTQGASERDRKRGKKIGNYNLFHWF